MRKFLATGILVCLLIVALLGILSACAPPDGSKLGKDCTVRFHTLARLQNQEGDLLIDANDIVSLTCADIWLMPKAD